MASRRLAKDLAELGKSEHPEYEAAPVGDNLFQWKGIIHGPAGTPYEGGNFVVNMTVPSDYPLKAPKVVFETKIYHPNISEKGDICLDILKKKWTPRAGLEEILKSLYYLLLMPDPDDALSTDIAMQYKTNRELFDSTAKEWTTTYASS